MKNTFLWIFGHVKITSMFWYQFIFFIDTRPIFMFNVPILIQFYEKYE